MKIEIEKALFVARIRKQVGIYYAWALDNNDCDPVIARNAETRDLPQGLCLHPRAAGVQERGGEPRLPYSIKLSSMMSRPDF